MNKINDLIEQLSNSEIEYKELGIVCETLKKGTLKTTELKKDGQYPVINSGRDFYGFYDNYNNVGNAFTLAARGEYAGFVSFFDKEFWAGGLCYPYRSKDESKLLTKYVYYYLKSKEKNIMETLVSRGSIPAINKSDIDKIMLPIPKSEVQFEIVKILDALTTLSAELLKEQESRKKQYQYYIDDFFSLDNKKELTGKIFTLEDLGTIIRGKRFVHADAVTEDGIPAIHYGELYTHYGISATETKSQIRKDIPKKLRYAQNGDVIIVGAGENNIDIGIGVAWLGDYEVAVHDACYTFHPNEKILPEYVSFYLRSNMYHQQIKKYVSEGKICAISAQGIGKAKIYVPSIEEQKKVINSLSVFDKLANDTICGIPAEINAREKQYQYYRDELLNFKRKKEA